MDGAIRRPKPRGNPHGAPFVAESGGALPYPAHQGSALDPLKPFLKKGFENPKNF